MFDEYPRPQMERESWFNLCGVWDCAFTDSPRPPKAWDGGTILVPFSPEAPASGVGRTLQPGEYLWYRRQVDFGPGEGKLLMQLPHALAKVAITAPSSVVRGSTAEVTFQVHAEDGTLPNAVIPMKITILDAEGKEAEFSGFHAAVKGEVTLRLEPAPNETPGTWQIIAEEFVSGKTEKVTIQLK